MYWWLRTHCKQRALPHFDTVWSILSFFSIRTFYQIIVATVTVFTSQLYQSIYRIPKIHKITVLGTREDERNSERPYSHHRKRTCSGSTWDRDPWSTFNPLVLRAVMTTLCYTSKQSIDQPPVVGWLPTYQGDASSQLLHPQSRSQIISRGCRPRAVRESMCHVTSKNRIWNARLAVSSGWLPSTRR